MDDAMSGFAREVLADQNLRSQVEWRKNATTGTQLATDLRAGGYTGEGVARLF